MLKIFLSFMAIAVLVDTVAFDGLYRQEVVGAAIYLSHKLVTLDWNLTHN